MTWGFVWRVGASRLISATEWRTAGGAGRPQTPRRLPTAGAAITKPTARRAATTVICDRRRRCRCRLPAAASSSRPYHAKTASRSVISIASVLSLVAQLADRASHPVSSRDLRNTEFTADVRIRLPVDKPQTKRLALRRREHPHRPPQPATPDRRIQPPIRLLLRVASRLHVEADAKPLSRPSLHPSSPPIVRQQMLPNPIQPRAARPTRLIPKPRHARKRPREGLHHQLHRHLVIVHPPPKPAQKLARISGIEHAERRRIAPDTHQQLGITHPIKIAHTPPIAQTPTSVTRHLKQSGLWDRW